MQRKRSAQALGQNDGIRTTATESTMYQNLLVPIDGSATAERGFQEAMALAERLHARLCLLHLIDESPFDMERAPATAYEQARLHWQRVGEGLLTEAQQRARARGLDCSILLREAGQQGVAEAIIDTVRQCGCDMIVMGTHGRRGLSRLTLGSDAELVLRSSPVPVMMVRLPEP
nr:universal stress protein [uncultured Roseateles sp.]